MRKFLYESVAYQVWQEDGTVYILNHIEEDSAYASADKMRELTAALEIFDRVRSSMGLSTRQAAALDALVEPVELYIQKFLDRYRTNLIPREAATDA